LTPSYVKAVDFRSAKGLAKYLLYLDENDGAYMSYHSWRRKMNPFTKAYVELALSKVPGADELDQTEDFQLQLRRAMCCRLCNREYLASERSKRGANDFVRPYLEQAQVEKRLFNGSSLDTPPGADQLLKPYLKRGSDGAEP
jgi:hypothetical protein